MVVERHNDIYYITVSDGWAESGEVLNRSHDKLLVLVSKLLELAQSFNFCPIKDLQLINSLSLLTLEKEL